MKPPKLSWNIRREDVYGIIESDVAFPADKLYSTEKWENLIRKAEIRSGWGLVNEHGFYCIAKNGSSNRKNTNRRERREIENYEC